MMRFKTMLFSFATLLFSASALWAQAGVTEPLISDITALRYGDTWQAGTVSSDLYYILLEPTFDVINPNAQSLVIMGSTYGYSFPTRSFRYPKEEFHYVPADWRGVSPGTEMISAIVFWPAGYGAVSGNWYNAGFKFVTLNIVITP